MSETSAGFGRVARDQTRIWRSGRRIVLPLLTLMGLLIVWQLAVNALQIPVWLLPAPTEVLDELIDKADQMPLNMWATLRVTLVGFGLAVVFGVLIGVVVTSSKLLQDTIMPLLVVTQAVPKAALAPLLLIWVGYGEPSAIMVAFLIAFFPMVVDTMTGLRTVQPELVALSRSLSASAWQTFWKVRFPSSLPSVFSGARVAVTLALIGAVIGEFVGSDAGLGSMIIVASSFLNTSLAFACILILALMGITLFYLVELAERILCPWIEEEPT